ncbi:MAG: gamma carbonic anhydrase family protein [Planctomycetes bacterium]|nr:gamma carbonic anhydrase family protein [Planctomycetota bacterium]
MAIIKGFGSQSPRLAEPGWQAENAVLIGDVETCEYCSIWYNAVLRGDVNHIRVGRYSNIQDAAVVHCNGDPSHPTLIGEGVSVGHGVQLHGCTLADACLIGIGAIVLNGASVGDHSIVAAGALVLEGQVIPAGCLYAGVPAKKMRELTPSERDRIEALALHYWRDLASVYAAGS